MRTLDIKFRSRIVFFLMLSFGFLNGYAQYNPMPVITKPSSEALSIEKFGEIPVDLFSGRVNITIPLYTAKQYDVAVPISLSYHGGGIKVTDTDAPAGLGWTLFCGGVISRSVRGMPDEMYDQAHRVLGFNNLEKKIYTEYPNGSYDDERRDFVNAIKKRIFDYNPIDKYRFDTYNDIWCYLGHLSNIYGEQYDQGHFDTAQDTYSFNFMGMSGVFLLNKPKSASEALFPSVVQTDDGVNIKYDQQTQQFIVKDKNGFTYRFADKEYLLYKYQVAFSWNDYFYNNGFPDYTYRYPSAWWLSSVTSPSGETITFNYTTSENIVCEPNDISYWHYRYSKEKFVNYSGQPGDCVEITEYYTGGGNTRYKYNTMDKVTLASIETKNGVILFDFTRTDCSDMLQKIRVIPNSLNADERSKEINFYYSPLLTSEQKTDRLKLDSLKITGENDNDPKVYKLSYVEKDKNGWPILADKNSLLRDHWGYGALEYGGLYPSPVTYFGSYTFDDGYINRNSEYNGAVAGMLKSITYPSGGLSDLTWEPNTFSKLGSTSGISAASDNSFFDNLEDNFDVTNYDRLIKASGTLKKLSDTIQIATEQSIKIDLSGYYNDYFQKHDPLWERCVTGWSVSDTAIYNIHLPYLDIRSDDNSVKKIIRIYRPNIESRIISIFLNPGRYIFTLKNPRGELGHCPDAECQEFYYRCEDSYEAIYGQIKISYFKTNSAFKDGYIVGGCRIQQITNISGNDTITKYYNYSLDGMDPRSPTSGVLAFVPRYGSCISKAYYDDTFAMACDRASFPWQRETTLYYLNSYGLPSTLNGGTHIEYGKVTESIIRNGHLDPNDPERADKKQTSYYYCTSEDSYCGDQDETNYGTIVPACQLMLTSKRHMRGHLKKKIEYTDERKETVYNYQILEKADVDTITGTLFTVADYTELPYINSCSSYDETYGTTFAYKDFGIVKYRVIPYNKRLIEETDTGTIRDKYTKYTYYNSEYSSNMLCNSPTSVSSIDSEGDTITEYYTYTPMNRVNTCVTVKRGRIVRAYRDEYNDSSQIIAKYTADIDPDSPPLASGYQLGQNLTITNNSHPIYLLTNSLEETYLYDNNRLVEVKNQKTNSPTTYLWSYNGDHPVAEIRNAAFNEVVSQLGMENIANIFHSLNPDKSAIDQMRNTMPQWFVTTITYKLLTGISSITDPKGTVSTFEYDSSGNLKNIKDHNNKLLQTIYVKYIGEYL